MRREQRLEVFGGLVMSLKERLERLGRWSVTEVRHVTHRLGLTWKGWCALGASVLALVAAMTVLGGVSEDVTQHNGLASSDPSHLRFFTDHRPGFLVQSAHIATDLGNAAVLALLVIGAGLLLWRRGLPVVAAAAPAFALGVTALLSDVAKRLVDRGRPPVPLRLLVEGEPSFPSGHAANSAAVYLTLGLVIAVFVLRSPLSRVAVVAGAGLVAGAVGTSRLVLGVHWPSDVLAGWALGTSIALVTTLAATLFVLLKPTTLTPRPGWLHRAALVLYRVLTYERHAPRRRPRLQAA
ncbi:MAG TPA: phosphatase PAP2 family protein [Acidimicrobiia bacterium]|nr:phosphatase PAP2 family protein [Acidimicrobiia bacterium]